jgi:CBS domain containing-hemolysin-like protein
LEPFLLVRIIILVSLLGLSGFFSSSETALFSLNQFQTERIKQEKGKKGARLGNLLKRPRQLIISVLMGNELVNVAISITGTSILVHLYGDAGKYLAIAIVTGLVLVLGEIIPKSLALRNAEKYALKVSTPLTAFSTAIYPLRRSINFMVDGILRAMEKRLPETERHISEEEFLTLVNMGREEGVIHEEERELIEKVFDFGDATVAEVMTPRTDVFALDIEEEIPEVLSKVKNNIYSRVPVYEGSIDEIRGVVNIKELLYHVRMGRKDLRLSDLLQPPFQVPETKKVSELFEEFRKGMTQFAIVIDEYGGMSGLVTLEDLLEELVGEIMDEFDKEEHAFRPVGRQAYLVSAMMPIDDFNRQLGVDLQEQQVETVGGYVLHLFGRVPRKGEKVQSEGVLFTVEEVRGPRIMKLLVEVKGG